MTQTKTQALAALLAATMLASTIGIGAAERAPLQESIGRAAKSLAAQSPAAQASTADTSGTTRRDGAGQDPVPSARYRQASCGIPKWMKYSLVAAAAAGGGYAASQIGHHNGHGGQRGSTDNDGSR